MAVKIKLKRMGKIRTPQYRIIVANAGTKRDGKPIEEIGKYHPLEEPSFIEVNSERAQYWLSVGAQPTTPVHRILRLTGDWQRFKGLPEPPPMQVGAAKPDKEAEFQAVLKELVLPEAEEKPKGGAKKRDKGGKSESAGGSAEKTEQAAQNEQSGQTGGEAEQDSDASAAKNEG